MNPFMRRAFIAGLLAFCTISQSACVGPSHVSRYVDERYNQFYVDSPVITQAASPLIMTASVVTNTVDLVIVNPFFWWKDALDGRGTPYYYQNPTVPMQVDGQADTSAPQ